MAKKTNFEVNGNKYFRVTRTIGKKADGTPIRKSFYGTGINEANEKADEYINKFYWLRLIRGANKIKISGNCTITFVFEFPRKVGCL